MLKRNLFKVFTRLMRKNNIVARIVILTLTVTMVSLLASCGAGKVADVEAGRTISSGDADTTRAAIVDDYAGTVTATAGGIKLPAVQGMALLRRDYVGTASESWSSLELDEGCYVLIEENSDVQISQIADYAKNTEITIVGGKMWVYVTTALTGDESFVVKTPACALSIRGTVFSVSCDEEGSTRTVVYEGTVQLTTYDERGDEVVIDVTNSAVEVTMSDGVVVEVVHSELTDEDLAPLYAHGWAGPGGVETFLRTRMPALVWDEDNPYGSYLGSSGMAETEIAEPSSSGDEFVYQAGASSGIVENQNETVTIQGIEYPMDATAYQPSLMTSNTDEDIVLIGSLPNLQYLSVYGPQITDIRPLGKLTQLAYLSVGSQQVLDLSPLQDLSNLHSLRIGSAQELDLSPLQALSSLNQVNAWNVTQNNIRQLSMLNSLEMLELSGEYPTDLIHLQSLENLDYLLIEGLSGTDFSPLGEIRSLRTLHIYQSSSIDLGQLQGLANIEILSLDNNELTDISQLGSMTNVKHLSLSGNKIVNIDALAGLINLVSVDLSGNSITDFTPLYGLSNLRDLAFGENINQTQIDELQAALPNCNITSYFGI